MKAEVVPPWPSCVRQTEAMDTFSSQTGPIAVYGASGYTGKLIAAELDRAGTEFVLAGRNREKLDRVAAGLEGDPSVEAISVDDAAGLRKLFGQCAAVIACAGPFTDHGEPVLAAAVDSGAHYLDTTGEQSFIRMAFDKYSARAEAEGIAMIPAMGFDYVPGDMLAALTTEGMGRIETVRLAYSSNLQPTRGTMRSGLEMIKGGDVEWRDGSLRPASQAASRGKFDFGPPLGSSRMVHYPAGEHITVPRHVPARNVETMLGIDALVPGPLAPLWPLVAHPTRLAMHTPVKKLAGRLIGRLPEGASSEARAAASFTVVCEAVRADRIRRGSITGRDVYGLTAALIVKGARIAAGGGIDATGALAPSQAFDPEAFLEGFDSFSLEWKLEPAP